MPVTFIRQRNFGSYMPSAALHPPAAGPSYETESQAIFSAHATMPDATHKGQINTFVLALKACGAWAIDDGRYVFAAPAEADARINWKNPGTYNATLVNTPSFTANVGFTGNGTNSYVNTNFNPSTAGGNFGANSCHAEVRVLSLGTDASSNRVIGNDTSDPRFQMRLSSGNIIYRVLGAEESSGVGATGGAHLIMNRSGSGATQFYKNGGKTADGTAASSGAPANSNIFFGREDSYSDAPMASGSIGGSYSSGIAAAVYAAETAYLTARGTI